MRVISQDKDYSVNFDSTPFWMEGQCVYATVGNKSITLAAYKTADRAKEVFQEMHDAFYPPLPKIPESAVDMSADEIIAWLNNQVTITPAVLTIPHEEGHECIYNPRLIYYMPEG